MTRLPHGLVALLLAASTTAADNPPRQLQALAERLGVPCTAAAKAQAEPSLLLVGLQNGKTPPAEARAAVRWDGESLIVAVRCQGAGPEGLNVNCVTRDGDVWKGEAVEVMLLPGVDHTGSCYHFAVSPAGSVYDAKDQDKGWNAASAKVAVRALKNAWHVQLTVPAAELVGRGKPTPALWRVNVHRSRPRTGRRPALDVAWSPTYNRSNHVPSRFGLVLLAGIRPDWKAANAAVDKLLASQVVLRQDFEKDRKPFDAGEIVTGDGPAGGNDRYLRIEGRRGTMLAKPLSNLAGLHMALAYRCNGDQHGVVVHGSGRPVRAARPGRAAVIGRGLEVARQTCRDADGQTRAWDLGLDAYRFLRPYGHCQQGNMPPTSTREWAVASFDIDDMYTNDGHRRISPTGQSYEGFRIHLNGKLPAKHWLEIGWVVIWRGRDSKPPTPPGEFKITPRHPKPSRLAWLGATDDIQVSHYEILRKAGDAWKPVTIATTNPLEAKLPEGTYALRAVDVAGNLSQPSNSFDLRFKP